MSMTAADHVKAAQEALELSGTYRADGAYDSADRCLREAQVHATLADVLDRLEQRPCARCGCVRNCECDFDVEEEAPEVEDTSDRDEEAWLVAQDHREDGVVDPY